MRWEAGERARGPLALLVASSTLQQPQQIQAAAADSTFPLLSDDAPRGSSPQPPTPRPRSHPPEVWSQQNFPPEPAHLCISQQRRTAAAEEEEEEREENTWKRVDPRGFCRDAADRKQVHPSTRTRTALWWSCRTQTGKAHLEGNGDFFPAAHQRF